MFKRYFYHYFCLAYSFIQTFISVAFVVAIAEQIEFDKQYGDYGNTIIIIVISLLMLFILAIPDKFIRGVKNEGFWSDCLVLTVVSPFRFIFQLITTIRVHIALSYGNESFGKRGNTNCLLSNYFYYYLFNAEHEDPRSGAERRYETKRGKVKREKKRAEQQAVYNEIMGRMNREVDEAESFLRVNRRYDGRYNVNIIPLCSVDDKDLSTFSVQNNSYKGERFINELYVDGKKIIYDMNFANTVALSLRPGYYDFKVVVKGTVKATGYASSEGKVNRTFELKNVYVGDDDAYLCVCLTYGSVVTRYTEKYTGKFVRDEFDHFKKEHKFLQVSLGTLNQVCNYWEAYKVNIDQVYSGYAINRKRNG